MINLTKTMLFLIGAVLLAACGPAPEDAASLPARSERADSTSPSATEAAAFVAAAEERLAELYQNRERQLWIPGNFITEDTELQAAKASTPLGIRHERLELFVQPKRRRERPWIRNAAAFNDDVR